MPELVSVPRAAPSTPEVRLLKNHGSLTLLPALPGDIATPHATRQLADEYSKAAQTLFDIRRKRKPLSLAPCRLTAIHAIELYLNAFLQYRGRKASELRGLQHNFAARSKLATEAGLKLKKLTAAHLNSMSGNKEYVASRYATETSSLSQINRLMATLNEVSTKVAAAIAL